MTSKNKNLNKLFICEILCLLNINNFLYSNPATANGWVQNKGEGIIIPSIRFQSFYGIDTVGNFDKNKRIFQNIFQIYGEYGISNRVTLGTKIIAVENFLNKNSSPFSARQARSFGLDTSNIFTRIGIIRHNERIALSVVGQLGFPSAYKVNEVSYYAVKCWSYETLLELGLNISSNIFSTASIGYHDNIHYWYDEVRAEILLGFYLYRQILFIARFQKYFYVIKNKTAMNEDYSFLKVSAYDFLSKSGFAKFTLSLAIPLDNRNTFEIGFYSSFKDKLFNTQKLDLHLTGFYASLWIKI